MPRMTEDVSASKFAYTAEWSEANAVFTARYDQIDLTLRDGGISGRHRPTAEPGTDPERLKVFGPTRRQSAPLRTVGQQGAEKWLRLFCTLECR